MTSFIATQDGTVLVCDAEIGTVSARTREEAEREIARRKAAKRREKAA